MKYSLFIIVFLIKMACSPEPNVNATNDEKKPSIEEPKEIRTGAEQTEAYLPLLKDKKVALIVNQTSIIKEQHLVDSLVNLGVDIKKIFAPEHGFRGKADAGEIVKDGIDVKTGLPITSLYGKNKKPSKEMLAGIDIVVFDIQDVGARFYTYISTMSYAMEACAENHVEFLVLDRPNPNGHYVDGPVLEKEHSSFVGLHPIPIVHGMTVAEYAQMVNGEAWLKDGIKCNLSFIPCQNYDHNTFYNLPVKPSPNLPNMKAIYLYPSLCLFEGTVVSVGRGTDTPFQHYGHPDYRKGGHKFTPAPNEGAKYPKHEGKECAGLSFKKESLEDIREEYGFKLINLLGFYETFDDKNAFFNKNNFFEKLAGTKSLRQQIIDGKTEAEIKASWEPALSEFKSLRKKYLLYKDFN